VNDIKLQIRDTSRKDSSGKQPGDDIKFYTQKIYKLLRDKKSQIPCNL